MKELSKKAKILSLFAISSATSMIFLDATIIPVALPTIQRDLLVSENGVQWILNSYLLAIATLVFAGGKLADMWGHRRVFCIGMLIFATASAIGGLAPNGGWLIISRSIQGVGGAMMGPSALSLVIDTFPERKRGRYLGVIVGFSSLFLSLGPFLGGVFTQLLSWRLLFWINFPIAIIGVLLALVFLPRSKRRPLVFDFFGFVTFSCALSALVLGLMQGKIWGWTSLFVLGSFTASLLFVTLLVITERRAKEPFFDFHLFSIRPFLGGSIVILLAQFILTMTIFWAIYFQNILGYTPMQAGSMTLIATLPVLFFAPMAGHLVDRFGPRPPMAFGLISMALGLIWFYLFLDKNSPWLLVPALLAYGTGISLVMTPNSTATLSSVPEDKRGAASGIYNTMRYVGATLGVAILGALITNLSHISFVHELKKDARLQHINPHSFVGFESRMHPSLQTLQAVRSPLRSDVVAAFLKASFFGYSVVTLVTAAIALIALVVTFIFNKKKSRL